jgi:hypothetical protein
MVEEAMIKLLYKPISILVSVLGGVLAGVIFKQVWLVKAAVDRGAAEGTRRLTGVWPGEGSQQSKNAA